jgi:rubrerythrin
MFVTRIKPVRNHLCTRRKRVAFDYSASEIYQMGIEIEKNGRAFYSACARKTKNETVKKLCEELSAWEAQHIVVFETLKSQLPENARLEVSDDPNNELQLYLKAAADTNVFIVNSDVDVLLATANTPAKILATALAFEKDSVVVYTTMSRLVPDHLGKKSLDRVIDEELKHISVIAQKIAMMKK